jgi:lysozyme
MHKIGLIGLFCLMMLAIGIVSAQEQTYTVQRGDTITAIANRFDVSVDDLLIRNNLIDPNRIRAGQVLTIPAGTVAIPPTHMVAHGETLTDIALRYDTTPQALTDNNAIANPNQLVVGQVINLPVAQGQAAFDRIHRVDIGETLQTIAARYGTTWQALARANNIANPNYIQAGMTLHVPANSSGTTATHVPQQTTYTPPPQPTQTTYVVQAGDLLSAIALHFGTTADAIRQLNGITDSRRIFPGDVLLIPVGTAHPTPAPQRHLVGRTYHVQAGDTLFEIAAAFHVNIYDLAEANGLLNLNHIFVGQALHIPGH